VWNSQPKWNCFANPSIRANALLTLSGVVSWLPFSLRGLNHFLMRNECRTTRRYRMGMLPPCRNGLYSAAICVPCALARCHWPNSST
jgi:hypothetical protein